VFEFRIQNDLLLLNSNDYSFYCGMGVEFGSEYVKGGIDIKMPTALEVGIVETKEQDELFKKLVGDKYSDFIMYTSHVFYSELTWNGEKVKAGESYLRVIAAVAGTLYLKSIYMLLLLEMMASIIIPMIKNYADRIPEPMAEWASRSDKIFYNYKEL